MTSPFISEYVARFNATKNPLFIARATLLVLAQRRTLELAYGAYCAMFSRPSVVRSHPCDALPTTPGDCRSMLSSERLLSRGDLIDAFGANYSVHSLPADFAGARMQSIVRDHGFLVIGEYGHFMKRVVHVTRDSCAVSEHYTDDPHVRHIHAVHKACSSTAILITTGDAAKYLDLWSLRNGTPAFRRRLRRRLAGHSAITKVGATYYLGTDFSSRPNYIERLDGKKFFFPRKAYRMCVTSFHQHLSRYILAINQEIAPIGRRGALSVFDTVTEQFVFCDYLDRIQTDAAGQPLHMDSASPGL